MIYDYLIVGSGITGSTIAYELHKQGYRVIVVEKKSHIGGAIYTEVQNEIMVHKYGAHIFHTNQKWIWDYVNNFTFFRDYNHKVIANFRDQFYNLPFNMNTFKQIFNTNNETECLQKLYLEIFKYKDINPKNLEEQALQLVGESVYEKLIKGYTEKQWGKLCTELPADIIKRLPLRFNSNDSYFEDEFQGIPAEGYTKLIENMLNGIEVKLNYDYNKHKNEIKATTIIHTGMIDEYYNYCFGKLEYRSLRFESKLLPYFQYQKYPVVNYTDKEIPYTRIIEHKHFYNTSTRWTIITKEFPELYSEGKEAYYPINTERNIKLYNEYKKLADADNIIFCGRLGFYKYLNMDQAILEAFKVVNNLKSFN